MALSIFDDKSKQPTDKNLAKALGKAKQVWDDLMAHLAEACDPMIAIWKYSGPKWGWSLAVARGKRTIIYLTPCQDHFQVGFALGAKAVAAARKTRLPKSVLLAIDQAPRYAEGTALRLKVTQKADLPAIKKLTTIKIAN